MKFDYLFINHLLIYFYINYGKLREYENNIHFIAFSSDSKFIVCYKVTIIHMIRFNFDYLSFL